MDTGQLRDARCRSQLATLKTHMPICFRQAPTSCVTILLELAAATAAIMVCAASELTSYYHLTYTCMIDWSKEQLDKHEKELRSLLGNLFSRTHSDAVMSRLTTYLDDRAAILEFMSDDTTVDKTMNEIREGLRTLASDVGTYMSKMEIKLALERVVAQLGMVRSPFTSPCCNH